MENRRSSSLTLNEAIATLNSQWREGNPDLAGVVVLLSQPNVAALLELVAEDARLSQEQGNTVTTRQYLEQFPELRSQESVVEYRLQAVKKSLASNNRVSENFFSEDSLPPIEMFSSSAPAETGSSSQSPSHLAKSQTYKYPTKIGNFHIDRCIGRGGFGLVLEATDLRLGRKVAIKIKCGAENGLSDDFLHEARSISRLDHPNIVRLLQADETEDGVGYLVYEHVDGQTLQERIKNGDYSIEECVQWIASIADALDYAHRRGIVHRDVSPRNIMITKSGTACLLDFGLSSVDSTFYREDKNRIMGTILFMSPEHASGNPHWATSYADIFSLGSVLYYALTQRFAFQGTSELDTLERIQKASPSAPRSIRSEISSKLEEVCLRALAKEPQLRFSTGADMSAALINSLEAARNVSTPKTSSWAAYGLVVVGCLLAVCGLSIALAGLWQLSPQSLPAKISEFDVLIDTSQGQVSLLYESDYQPESTDLSDKDLRKGFVNAKANPTVTTSLAHVAAASYYIFRFTSADSGEWIEIPLPIADNEVSMGSSFRKSEKLEPGSLRPGPNIILLVCASSASKLKDLNDTLNEQYRVPFRYEEGTNDSPETQDLLRVKNYIFSNIEADFYSKDKLWNHVYEQDNKGEVVDKGLVARLSHYWNDDRVYLSKDLKRGLDQGGFLYFGTAFCIYE